MTESQSVHGLAGTIRSSTESETFDLGGLSGSSIESVISHAFDQPFPKMIRVTLVVGAGKQARQKYDAQALKVVTSKLQSLGFVEDRGASCVPECAGMYKLQHDTGKNLKTVVVFPKLQLQTVIDPTRTDIVSNAQTTSSATNGESLLVHGSLESKIAVVSFNVFSNMVQSQCPTWSQKKALLNLIDDSILSKVNECDRLLVTGQLLSPAQQSFYDSCREITDKRDYLHEQLQAHVDRGDLTKVELDHLKHLNDQKMDELQKAGQSTLKAQERHDKLHSIQPVDPPKLKHHAELGKLWKQLAPLQHLDETSNRLLSVQDTKLMGKKLELLQQIQDLENASRGWLEDDHDFEARVQTSRRLFQAQFGVKNNKNNSINKSTAGASISGKATTGSTTPTISSNTKAKVPVSKWVTPVETKLSVKAKKKAKLQKGDVFGAMMVTAEDSESEQEESEDEQQQITAETTVAPTGNEIGSSPNNRPAATSGTSSKKKKNKKKSTGDKLLTGTDALLSVNTKSSASKKEEDQQQQTMPWALISLIQTIVVSYLLPLLLAIVQFLIVLLFGKSKDKKNKKQ